VPIIVNTLIVNTRPHSGGIYILPVIEDRFSVVTGNLLRRTFEIEDIPDIPIGLGKMEGCCELPIVGKGEEIFTFLTD